MDGQEFIRRSVRLRDDRGLSADVFHLLITGGDVGALRALEWATDGEIRKLNREWAKRRQVA